MKRLASDMILWKHFRLVRNADMITSRLFRESRPDRMILLRNNVLKGIQAHQVKSGDYINGPELRSLHETSKTLEKRIKQQNLTKTFKNRPERAELEIKGVLPLSMGGVISPALQPRIANLQTLLGGGRLSPRSSREELRVCKSAPAPSPASSDLELDLY
jgi:hypothetical protein